MHQAESLFILPEYAVVSADKVRYGWSVNMNTTSSPLSVIGMMMWAAVKAYQ
jgi:hypothetical protein